MRQSLSQLVCVVAVLGAMLWCAAPASAKGPSSGRSTGGSLHTGTGGTGISKSGGSGGTGLSSHGTAGGGHYHGIGAKTPTGVSSAASNTQQKMVPAKPFTPPPAGVRPQTDLAAATKLIGLSSANLVKHSQLFAKQAAAPGGPRLSGPVLNSIGPTTGGSASFSTVQGFSAAESNAAIYPSTGRSGATKKQTPSLSTGASSTTLASAQVVDGARAGALEGNIGRSSGGLLDWLTNALTLAGIAGLGWYMWRQMPSGARITLPAHRVN